MFLMEHGTITQMSTRKSYCKALGCPGRAACRDCRNISSRATRAKHSELPEEARRRLNCRAYTKVYQSRGLLPKGPCEGCGAEEAQNHHPDYDQPRYYIRLCKDCHEALEAVIRATPH